MACVLRLRKAVDTERRDLHVGRALGDEVRDDLSRERREQDAVPAMAGGVPQPLDVGVAPPERLDGERAGQPADAWGPDTRREHRVLYAGSACGGDYSGDPALRYLDRLHRLGAQRGAEAAGVRQAGAGERLGVEGAVLGCEQGPVALGGGAGPALAHFVRLQPVAPQPRLALPGHLFFEAD